MPEIQPDIGGTVTSSQESTGNDGSMAEIVFMAVVLVVHLFIASQLCLLAQDVVYGDGSAAKLAVPLRYPAMRVPSTPVTAQFAAQGRLCADFAQIYFPSQNRSAAGDAYAANSTLDPWSRESKYPPLDHFLCSLTLCQLNYGPACLVHLGIQTLLFLGTFVYAFVKLGLKKYLLPSLLLVNFCLFLTPVGLSFLERGQFSLYVALCYLWLMLFIVKEKKRYIVLSAVFGFIKWTSFPLVFVVTLSYLLHARSWKEVRGRLVLPVIFGATVLLLFLAFSKDGMLFLKAISLQEMTYEPMGLTLLHLLPRMVVKAVPFLLVAAGCAPRFVQRKEASCLLPFFAGSAVLLVTYPTFAFDYSIPCLAAFVPCLIYWAKLPGVSKTVGVFVQGAFALFLLLASFSIHLFPSESWVVAFYLITALALIAASQCPFRRAGASAQQQRSDAATV